MFHSQASGRKKFGFKSVQTECWPDPEDWKSQGVEQYKEASDKSGTRYVLLTFGTRLTKASVEKRLAFLGVEFDTVETYGYAVDNAPHNSPIVQAMQDPYHEVVQWSEATRPTYKRKFEQAEARLAEQAAQHDQAVKKLRQEQQRENQTVQKLHQLMKEAHKAFHSAVRGARIQQGKRTFAEDFEHITSEWKALGGEPDDCEDESEDQDSGDDQDSGGDC